MPLGIFREDCKVNLYKAPSQRDLAVRRLADYRARPAAPDCCLPGARWMLDPRPTAVARWKLHARTTPVVFAFFMASIMAMLMCLVITAANAGIDGQFPARVLSAYCLAMPTAFCCVLVVRPLVVRLVALTVHPH